MAIKSKRSRDLHPLHQRATRAVGIAPPLIAMRSEYCPRPFLVIIGELEQPCETLAEEYMARPNRGLRSKPCLDERQYFVNNAERRLPQTGHMLPYRQTSLVRSTVKHPIVAFLRNPPLAFIRLGLFKCRKNSQCFLPITLIRIVPNILPARTNTNVAGMDADKASYGFTSGRDDDVLSRGLPDQLRCLILQLSDLGSLHWWLHP